MDAQNKVFRAHRALAWFYAFLGTGLTAFFLHDSHDGIGWSALIIMGIFTSVFLAHYLTARACKAGKAGGRYASIVISCIMLVGFPAGTMIGAYLLFNTRKPWNAPLDPA